MKFYGIVGDYLKFALSLRAFPSQHDRLLNHHLIHDLVYLHSEHGLMEDIAQYLHSEHGLMEGVERYLNSTCPRVDVSHTCTYRVR